MSGSTVAHAHVLVVDGAPSVRSLLGDILEAAGYQVTTAADGREALGRIQSSPPDLLLLDLEQPETSARELRAALRARSGTLPVLLLREEWKVSAEAAPACDRAGSGAPVDAAVVLHAVARLLGG